VPPAYDTGGNRLPSCIWPLLTTSHAVPAPLGTVVGVFFGVFFFPLVSGLLGPNLGMMSCLAWAMGFGLCYSLFADKIVKKSRAGRQALVLGCVVTLAIGPTVHWVLGVIMGTLLGTLYGSYLEYKQILDVKAQSFVAPTWGKSKVMASSQGGFEETPGDRKGGGLPTLVTAPTLTVKGLALTDDAKAQAIADGSISDRGLVLATLAETQQDGLGYKGRAPRWQPPAGRKHTLSASAKVSSETAVKAKPKPPPLPIMASEDLDDDDPFEDEPLSPLSVSNVGSPTSNSRPWGSAQSPKQAVAAIADVPKKSVDLE